MFYHVSPISTVGVRFEGQRWTRQEAIRDAQTGQVIGSLKQTRKAPHQVEIYQGKGGLCAKVLGKDVVYFGLPGSQIRLPGTEVKLEGAPIKGTTAVAKPPQTALPTQRVTDQAMILGAGIASRFEPVSGDTTGFAKPSVPLNGNSSVISEIAKHLKEHGFKKVVVNTFYKPQVLKNQLLAIQNRNLQFVFIDEDKPSGTAGGLVKALQSGKMDPRKPVFIIQGDAVTNLDISYLMKKHVDQNAAFTIGCQVVSDEDTAKFAILETDQSGGDGQSGQIKRYKEKPGLKDAGTSRLASIGFYILSPEILPLFMQAATEPKADAGVYDFAKDFFPKALEAVSQGLIKDQDGNPKTAWGQNLGGYWCDIGNPTQYFETLKDVYEGKAGLKLPANVQDYYDKGIVYWQGTKVIADKEKARLSGNVIVGSRFKS